jgi:hypothetical protein
MMPPHKKYGERMTPGSMIIVMLAVLRILPVLVGSKLCRKVGLGAVVSELRAQIPDNGAGPLVAERRDALLFLENNCRQCGRCRMARGL